MQTQYCVLGYKIDLYFDDYRLAVEVYEINHLDKNIVDEIKRQKAIAKELDSKFSSINPDEHNFNVFIAINVIYRRVKELSKISLIDDRIFKKIIRIKI